MVKNKSFYYYFVWINKNSGIPDIMVGPIFEESEALKEGKARFETYRKDGLIKVIEVNREDATCIYSVGLVADISQL